MSTRPLPEDRDSDSRYASDVDTIEDVAEAKGLADEIDDIDVYEEENDQGDQIVVFRIYTKKVLDDGEVDEKQSVGTQVTKMPDIQTAGNTFHNNVQNTLSQLKKYLGGSTGTDDDDELEEAARSSSMDEDDDKDDTSTDGRTIDYTIEADSPGRQIDEHLSETEARVSDLEDRVEELEEYVDALEGLQKLMGSSGDE